MEETLKRYSADFIDALDFFSACLKSAFQKKPMEMEDNINP